MGKVTLGILCAGAAAVAIVTAFSFMQVRPETQSQNANTDIVNVRSDADSAVAKTGDQLRDAAMTAYQAGQLFAPAGENAIELYLSALAQNPNDFGAREAILELIPPAASALEAAINVADPGEIERLSLILSKADPSSTRTTALIARGRTQIAANDAAKIRLASTLQMNTANAQQATLQTAEPVAVALPAPAAPALPAAIVATPANANSVEESDPVPAEPPVKAVASAPKAPAPTLASLGAPTIQTSIANRSIGDIVEARVIKSLPPMFPAEAKRRKASGWVDLKLQIDATGRVTDAAVIASKPGRIFDAEAKRAVMRWQFSPKMVDSTAVESTVNQRITFKPES